MVHLVSNGDCLYSTTIARQIKHEFPGCHLTWAISFKCRQVIEENPYVDTIWEIMYSSNDSPYTNVWKSLKSEVELKRSNGDFDEVFYLQLFPDNIHCFDGTIRSSLFNTYPGKITVPIEPIIKLRRDEVLNVANFANVNNLSSYEHVILCECTPSSGQSFLNLEIMLKVARLLVAARPDVILIISSHLSVKSDHERILDGSVLTFRENVELSKYCTLLVGCSSGLTWLLTADWAKKMPTVQFLNRTYGAGQFFASVKYDFIYWGISTENVIENGNQNYNVMVDIVLLAMEDFKKAKKTFDEEFLPSRKQLYEIIFGKYFNLKFKQKLECLIRFKNRNRHENSIVLISGFTVSYFKDLCWGLNKRLKSISKNSRKVKFILSFMKTKKD